MEERQAGVVNIEYILIIVLSLEEIVWIYKIYEIELNLDKTMR